MFLTLTEIKDYLGITDTSQDDLLTLLGEGVCSFIEKYTCTVYGRTEAFTEVLDGEGTDTIISGYNPATLTSLEIRNSSYNEDDWEIIDAKEYILLDEGMVRYMVDKFAERTGSVRLIGTYGYATTPSDITLIALMMIKSQMATGAGTKTAGAEKEDIGDYSITYSDISSMADVERTKTYEVLNEYKIC